MQRCPQLLRRRRLLPILKCRCQACQLLQQCLEQWTALQELGQGSMSLLRYLLVLHPSLRLGSPPLGDLAALLLQGDLAVLLLQGDLVANPLPAAALSPALQVLLQSQGYQVQRRLLLFCRQLGAQAAELQAAAAAPMPQLLLARLTILASTAALLIRMTKRMTTMIIRKRMMAAALRMATLQP